MAIAAIRSSMVSTALKVFLCVISLPVLYFLVELVRVVKLRILKVSTTPVDGLAVSFLFLPKYFNEFLSCSLLGSISRQVHIATMYSTPAG